MELYMKEYKRVEVEWDDSCSNNGWQCADTAKSHSTAQCRTVSYLVKSSKKSITLVQSLSNTGNISELMAIPRGCIKSIKVLK